MLNQACDEFGDEMCLVQAMEQFQEGYNISILILSSHFTTSQDETSYSC